MHAQAMQHNYVQRVRVVRINAAGRYPQFMLCIDGRDSSEEAPEITAEYIKKKMLARNRGTSEVNALISYAEDAQFSQATQLLFMNLLGRMDEEMAIVRIEKLFNLCAKLMHMPTIPA